MKKIDNLGRIVIPKSLRIKYNIKNGEELEITYIRDGNQNKTKIVLSE